MQIKTFTSSTCLYCSNPPTFQLIQYCFDLEYKDETTEVYIKTHDNDEREYYVDISFTGSEFEFLNIKEQIKNSLLKSDILYDVSFIAEDNEGNEIEEVQFIHPDFAKLYIPRGT